MVLAATEGFLRLLRKLIGSRVHLSLNPSYLQKGAVSPLAVALILGFVALSAVVGSVALKNETVKRLIGRGEEIPAYCQTPEISQYVTDIAIENFTLTQNPDKPDEYTAKMSWKEAQPFVAGTIWVFSSYRPAFSRIKPDGSEKVIEGSLTPITDRKQTSLEKTFKAADYDFEEGDAIKAYIRVWATNEGNTSQSCRTDPPVTKVVAKIKPPSEVFAIERTQGERGEYPRCGELDISWRYEGEKLPEFWDLRFYSGIDSVDAANPRQKFRLAGGYATKNGNKYSWTSPTCLFLAPGDYDDTDESSKMSVTSVFGVNESTPGLSSNFAVSSINWRRPQGCGGSDPKTCYRPCQEMCGNISSNPAPKCAAVGGACTFSGNCPANQEFKLWCGKNLAGVDFGACCAPKTPAAPREPPTSRGSRRGPGGVGADNQLPVGNAQISGTITTTQDTKYANLAVIRPDWRNPSFEFFYGQSVGGSRRQYTYSIDGIAEGNYIVVAFAGRTTTELPYINSEDSCTNSFTLPSDEATRREFYKTVIPVLKSVGATLNIDVDQIDRLDINQLDAWVQTYLRRLCTVQTGTTNQNYTIGGFPDTPPAVRGNGVLQGVIRTEEPAHEAFAIVAYPDLLALGQGQIGSSYLVIAPTTRGSDGKKFRYRIDELAAGSHFVTTVARRKADPLPWISDADSCRGRDLGSLLTGLGITADQLIANLGSHIDQLNTQLPIRLHKDVSLATVRDVLTQAQNRLCVTQVSTSTSQDFTVHFGEFPDVLTGKGVIRGTITTEEPSEEAFVVIGNPNLNPLPYLYIQEAARDPNDSTKFYYELTGVREEQHIVTALARRTSDNNPYISGPDDCGGNDVDDYLSRQGISIAQLGSNLLSHLVQVPASPLDLAGTARTILSTQYPNRLCLVPVGGSTSKDFNIYYNSRPGQPAPQPVSTSITSGPSFTGRLEYRNPGLGSPGQPRVLGVYVCLESDQDRVPGNCDLTIPIGESSWKGRTSASLGFRAYGWQDGSFTPGEQIRVLANAVLIDSSRSYHLRNIHNAANYTTMTVGTPETLTLEIPTYGTGGQQTGTAPTITSNTANTTTNTSAPGGGATVRGNIEMSANSRGLPTVVFIDVNTKRLVHKVQGGTSLRQTGYITAVPQGTYYAAAFVQDEKPYTFQVAGPFGVRIPVSANAPAINDPARSGCTNIERVEFTVAELISILSDLGYPQPNLQGRDPNQIFISQDLCRLNIQGDTTQNFYIGW